MILFINACVRADSRTEQLARALLRKLGGAQTEVKLAEQPLEPLSEARLDRRTELIERGSYDDPMFRLARQFQQADGIVSAAPYWDLGFPALLKLYLENIYVTGLVSEYTEEGIPRGLCRAKKLYYVMTAGGTYVPEEFGYGYVKALAQNFYGIQDVELIKAVGLDIIGADVNKIIGEAEV